MGLRGTGRHRYDWSTDRATGNRLALYGVLVAVAGVVVAIVVAIWPSDDPSGPPLHPAQPTSDPATPSAARTGLPSATESGQVTVPTGHRSTSATTSPKYPTTSAPAIPESAQPDLGGRAVLTRHALAIDGAWVDLDDDGVLDIRYFAGDLEASPSASTVLDLRGGDLEAWLDQCELQDPSGKVVDGTDLNSYDLICMRTSLGFSAYIQVIHVGSQTLTVEFVRFQALAP